MYSCPKLMGFLYTQTSVGNLVDFSRDLSGRAGHVPGLAPKRVGLLCHAGAAFEFLV